MSAKCAKGFARVRQPRRVRRGPFLLGWAMTSPSYQAKPCVQCLALAHASPFTPAHARLGRPRPEVGYQLYRCTACHAQWSLSGNGWTSEARYCQ